MRHRLNLLLLSSVYFFSSLSLGAPSPGNDVLDVVHANEYLEFSELDPLPRGRIRWGSKSGAFLYVSRTDLPYIFLSGWIDKKEEIQINHRWVPVENGYFEARVPLRLEPNHIEIRLFDANHQFDTYRLLAFWLKLPAGLKLRVREGEKIIEAGVSFSEQHRKSAFVQLYAKNVPVTHIDLDSQKRSGLSFRIYPPPDVDRLYDEWTFQLRNDRDITIAQIRGKGMPPPYLEWREVAPQVTRAGRYSYRMHLVLDGKNYEGAKAEFEAIEGMSLMHRAAPPMVQFEPRQEIGFFTFSNVSNARYVNSYAGLDVAFVLWNRWVTRGQGLVSLHSIDPRSSLNFVRLGTGFRFFGDADSAVFGKPFLYQVDFLLNYSGYTLSAESSIQRFTSASALIEPQLVLWKYHYVIPWIEFGARPSMDLQRISVGFQYCFFVRPWSLRLGLGISYDSLYRFDDDPTLKFKIMRGFGTLAFTL